MFFHIHYFLNCGIKTAGSANGGLESSVKSFEFGGHIRLHSKVLSGCGGPTLWEEEREGMRGVMFFW